MSEMVERMARAAFEMRHGQGAWSSAHDIQRNMYRQDMRAGLDALREPTDDMRRAGWHVLREKNDIQTRLGNSLVGTETPIYSAMIDAALK